MAPIPIPVASVCHRCQKQGSSPEKFMLQCCECKRTWHHSCHAPPVPEKELISGIRAFNENHVENIFTMWTCKRCGKKPRAMGTVTGNNPRSATASLPQSALAASRPSASQLPSTGPPRAISTSVSQDRPPIQQLVAGETGPVVPSTSEGVARLAKSGVAETTLIELDDEGDIVIIDVPASEKQGHAETVGRLGTSTRKEVAAGDSASLMAHKHGRSNPPPGLSAPQIGGKASQPSWSQGSRSGAAGYSSIGAGRLPTGANPYASLLTEAAGKSTSSKRSSKAPVTYVPQSASQGASHRAPLQCGGGSAPRNVSLPPIATLPSDAPLPSTTSLRTIAPTLSASSLRSTASSATSSTSSLALPPAQPSDGIVTDLEDRLEEMIVDTPTPEPDARASRPAGFAHAPAPPLSPRLAKLEALVLAIRQTSPQAPRESVCPSSTDGRTGKEPIPGESLPYEWLGLKGSTTSRQPALQKRARKAVATYRAAGPQLLCVGDKVTSV